MSQGSDLRMSDKDNMDDGNEFIGGTRYEQMVIYYILCILSLKLGSLPGVKIPPFPALQIDFDKGHILYGDSDFVEHIFGLDVWWRATPI